MPLKLSGLDLGRGHRKTNNFVDSNKIDKKPTERERLASAFFLRRPAKSVVYTNFLINFAVNRM